MVSTKNLLNKQLECFVALDKTFVEAYQIRYRWVHSIQGQRSRASPSSLEGKRFCPPGPTDRASLYGIRSLYST